MTAVLTNITFAQIGPVAPGTPEPVPSLTALDQVRQNPASYQYGLGTTFGTPSFGRVVSARARGKFGSA